jgi:tRNA pseudouridine13 synthase
VTADETQIETSLRSLQENGFLNYYGLQRFGNSREIPTYEIGKKLLDSKFKEACELIMKPRSGEKPFMEKMRNVWWKTQDAPAALKNVYKSNRSVEAKLLEGFVRHGKNDYVNALNSVPRNMRLLYLHAYQSLIFNKIVSRRVKEFGIKLIVGDLVFADANVEKLHTEKSGLVCDGDGEAVAEEQSRDEEKAEQVEVSLFKVYFRTVHHLFFYSFRCFCFAKRSQWLGL